MPAFTPVGVSAEVRGLSAFTRNLGKMDTSIQKTGKSAQGVGTQFLGLGNKVLGAGAVMAKVAAGAVVGLGAAMVGLGIKSVKTAISVESAFAGIVKTTDGLVDEFGNLTVVGAEMEQGFRDLAKEVPVAVEELMGIGEIAGQLGVGKEALVDFTKTVADLGMTTNLTTEEAAFNLARIANIFGIETEDMGENSQRLGSTIVDLGNNFATTERDIAAFAERIAGAGKIAGLTQADVLAIGTAMSSVGVQAEAGGTAVQKVLLAMNEAVVGTTTGFTDNSEAIEENQDKLLDLTAQLMTLEAKTGLSGQALWDQYQAFIAAGGAAADFGRELGDTQRAQLFKTVRTMQDLNAETDLLRENQGQPISAEGLETFARTAGLTAAEFKALWQEDASQAFELFVLGLGEQGDAAIGTLEELGLTDQRLMRSFLSLAGAGDLLSETLALGNEAWQENTALSEEAEKRYRTTEAQLQMLKNQLRDVGITIGDALLPFINDLIEQAKPLIEELGKRLPAAIEAVIAKIRELIGAFQTGGVAGLAGALGFSDETIATMQSIGQQIADAIQFVMEHWEAFKGALIAIGAVLAAAGIAAAIAGIAMAIGSLLSPIGLLVAAAAALGAAWNTNFLGMRDILTAFWENTARPALEQLVQWLQVNVPIAVAALSELWQTTLLPALQAVWNFIQANVLPILAEVWTWLADNLPPAIQALAKFWQTTLLPALRTVWTFIKDNIIPLLGALANVWIALVKLELKVLAGLWQNVLLPALRAVWAFIQDNVLPILRVVAEFISGTLIPAIQPLIERVDQLASSFGGVGDAIQTVIGFLNDLADKITNIQLPDWLKPGSATPFELGLLGIASALTGMVSAALQAFAAQSLAVFNQVRILVLGLDQTIANIHLVTMPQLQVVTRQTSDLMIAAFTAVQPVLEQVNALLVRMDSLLQSIASSAKEAADAMRDGFDEAAEKIEDKLLDALEDLVEALEEVEKAAEAAAAAVDSIGDKEPEEPPPGPGAQKGANFIVPPGFPRDTFPMRVSSGERVIVIPPGEAGMTSVGGETNFNMTVNTLASPASIIQQFEVMRALVG